MISLTAEDLLPSIIVGLDLLLHGTLEEFASQQGSGWYGKASRAESVLESFIPFVIICTGLVTVVLDSALLHRK